MGQDRAAIRDEIEHTRERMGDTVDALGYKADVPASARTPSPTRSRTSKPKSPAPAHSSLTRPRTATTSSSRPARRVAQQNPLGLAIGAAAVGFIAGLLIPSTKVEDERLGPVADQVKEQARQTGQQAIEHGKQ